MGEGAEEQHRSARGAQHHEAPQFSAAPLHEKGEGGGACRQTVGRVQQGGEPGQPQPEGAQQIIQRTQGQAQQDGLAEGQQLLRDLVPHSQPNSRLKKPPRLRPSSS